MYKVSSELQLVLASGSPRRKELLESCVTPFAVSVSDVDETPLGNELPELMVVRLAQIKAQAVAKKFQMTKKSIIIGADTTVVCKGENLGKPIDVKDAQRMLGLLQGSDHQVWSAFAIIDGTGTVLVAERSCSVVRMRPLNIEQIASYVATGEPMDKAGAYAIQGVGMHLIESVQGSYTNVVGVNLAALIAALQKLKVIH